MRARSSRIATLVALAGCGGGAGPACGLAARPSAPAVGFDANSDGVVDVADGAFLLARNFRGGEDPPCFAAVEAYADPVEDSGTAYAIWTALTGGTAIPELAPGTCGPAPERPAACGDGLALGVLAPARIQGRAEVTFDAVVTLTSPVLPVEGWTVSVEASGCTVTSASLAGTIGADRHDDPRGRRDGGVGMAQVSGTGGAVSLVVLDALDGDTVTGSGLPILSLGITAPVGGSCGSCTLTLRDGQAGRGRPLTNTASSAGRSYAPAAGEASVEICPG